MQSFIGFFNQQSLHVQSVGDGRDSKTNNSS